MLTAIRHEVYILESRRKVMDKMDMLRYLRMEGFSEQIVDAFAKVPRERFVKEGWQSMAYEDAALPLEEGATISQPFTIAFMLSLLEVGAGHKVLEIGSGCGYVLALLSELAGSKVYGVEISELLSNRSRGLLAALGYRKTNVVYGDGTYGFADEAPFDRILVSASAERIPVHWYDQLADGGVLVVPIRDSIVQIKKEKDEVVKKEFPGFVFVPLISADDDKHDESENDEHSYDERGGR